MPEFAQDPLSNNVEIKTGPISLSDDAQNNEIIFIPSNGTIDKDQTYYVRGNDGKDGNSTYTLYGNGSQVKEKIAQDGNNIELYRKMTRIKQITDLEIEDEEKVDQIREIIKNSISELFGSVQEQKNIGEKLEETENVVCDVIDNYKGDFLLFLNSELDPTTINHSINTMVLGVNYFKKYPEELDKEGLELKDVALGILLHDIGKLHPEVKTLIESNQKYDKHNNVDVWTAIKKHPLYGIEILENINKPFNDVVKEIISGHHERLDGTGYPKGLKDSEISYAQRLITIIDSFEAMTSVKRVYNGNNVLKPRDALDLLMKDCENNRYDKKILERFIISLRNDS